MDYLTINNRELSALNGLPFLQRLVYLQGLRPYVDYETGIVGVKRGVSYQSISEILYIEPHPGIQSGSPSKDQLRRALRGLVKAGLLESLCTEKNLIFKCMLVEVYKSVQNKLAIKPPPQTATPINGDSAEEIRVFDNNSIHSATPKTAKAAIPQYNNYYIFLFKQFSRFWELYPIKKSQQYAWKVFQEINPSDELIEQILSALQAQINFIQQQKAQGLWVPNWKNPANWLAQQCWADELTHYSQDIKNANYETSHTQPTAYDPLWSSCGSGSEDESGKNGADETSNVISFARRANERETY